MSRYYTVTNGKRTVVCHCKSVEKTLEDFSTLYQGSKLPVVFSEISQRQYFHTIAERNIAGGDFKKMVGLMTKAGLPILYVRFGIDADDEATCNYIVIEDGYMTTMLTIKKNLIGGNI